MPIKQEQKVTKAAQRSDVDYFRIAALYPIDSNGKIVKNYLGNFLINPSTYEDVKGANWVINDIPGQSDPVLQWVSSGARVVTFDALITRDTSDFKSAADVQVSQNNDLLSKALSTGIGSIAAKFFNVSAPAPVVRNIASNTNLSIATILDYYRSLLYPIYDDKNNPQKLISSPPLLVLFEGGAIHKKPYGTKISSNHDVWVLTNLRVKITKQLRNLHPLEAIVSFQLTQYNIKSFSRKRFDPSA